MLLVLLTALLPACTYELQESEADSMLQPGDQYPVNDKQLTRWGQSRNVTTWAKGSPNILLDLTAQQIGYPKTLNVALSALLLGDPGAVTSASFRWSLLIGSGGAAKEVLVDARPFQQLSVSGSSLKVSILANDAAGGEIVPPVAYITPVQTVQAAALVGLGNTSTERATYTVLRGSLADAAVWQPVIPAGASSYRLLGGTPAASATGPFKNTVFFTWSQNGFLVYSAHTGLDMAPDDYWPIPGGASVLSIQNTSGAPLSSIGIQWGLDL